MLDGTGHAVAHAPLGTNRNIGVVIFNQFVSVQKMQGFGAFILQMAGRCTQACASSQGAAGHYPSRPRALDLNR